MSACTYNLQYHVNVCRVKALSFSLLRVLYTLIGPWHEVYLREVNWSLCNYWNSIRLVRITVCVPVGPWHEVHLREGNWSLPNYWGSLWLVCVNSQPHFQAHSQALPTRLYCKQQKAGWDLGMRLVYNCNCRTVLYCVCSRFTCYLWCLLQVLYGGCGWEEWWLQGSWIYHWTERHWEIWFSPSTRSGTT